MVFDERNIFKEADSLENRKPLLFDQVKWDMGADLTTYPLKRRYQQRAKNTYRKNEKARTHTKTYDQKREFRFFWNLNHCSGLVLIMAY